MCFLWLRIEVDCFDETSSEFNPDLKRYFFIESFETAEGQSSVMNGCLRKNFGTIVLTKTLTCENYNISWKGIINGKLMGWIPTGEITLDMCKTVTFHRLLDNGIYVQARMTCVYDFMHVGI